MKTLIALVLILFVGVSQAQAPPNINLVGNIWAVWDEALYQKLYDEYRAAGVDGFSARVGAEYVVRQTAINKFVEAVGLLRAQNPEYFDQLMSERGIYFTEP